MVGYFLLLQRKVYLHKVFISLKKEGINDIPKNIEERIIDSIIKKKIEIILSGNFFLKYSINFKFFIFVLKIKKSTKSKKNTIKPSPVEVEVDRFIKLYLSESKDGIEKESKSQIEYKKNLLLLIFPKIKLIKTNIEIITKI